MDVTSKLAKTIGTGELLTIIYQGGSQPGRSRMILPITIEGDKVRARCYLSNKVKSFSIEKITIVDNPDGATNYILEDKLKPLEPANLIEAITPHLDEIKKLGWHVLLEDKAVGACRIEKGQSLKEPDIFMLQLEYDEKMPDGSIYRHFWATRNREFVDKTALIKRQMPFYVKYKQSREAARSFKSLLHATETFMKYIHDANEDKSNQKETPSQEKFTQFFDPYKNKSELF